jgi:hypothetical protein
MVVGCNKEFQTPPNAKERSILHLLATIIGDK